MLMEEGGITGFAAEPGAYEWDSDASTRSRSSPATASSAR